MYVRLYLVKKRNRKNSQSSASAR